MAQAAVIQFLALLLLQAEVVVVVAESPQVLVVQAVVAQMVQMQVGPQVHQAKETLVVALQAQDRQTSLPLAVVVRVRRVQVLAQVAHPALVVLV
jgi:hypothetical protein